MNINASKVLIENVLRANPNNSIDPNQHSFYINAKDENGHSALYSAVRFGLTDAALELINLGADINTQDDRGISLLHFALSLGRKEIFSALLERGAKIDTVNAFGISPLSTAAYSEDPGVALKLVAYGANIAREMNTPAIPKELKKRSQSKLDKLSALSMHQGAAQGGHTQRLVVLFNHFPSSARSDQPQALLKLALKHKRDDCAAFLQSVIASQAIDDLLVKKPWPKSM